MAFSNFTRRHFISGISLAGALSLLPACTETASDFNASAAPRARAPGVPVALVSLDGAPETVTSRLSSAISQQAAKRDIMIVGVDGQPRYQVRGYVSVAPGPDGKGEVNWAFDIFDAKRKRARRFSGQESVAASVAASGDIWSGVTDQDLQKIAFRSLDEIAEFLAASPEAVAARGVGTSSAGQVGSRATSLIAGQ
jgi:hypothetical protein